MHTETTDNFGDEQVNIYPFDTKGTARLSSKKISVENGKVSINFAAHRMNFDQVGILIEALQKAQGWCND